MTPELMYLLKANICIAVFYVFYKLICSGDTFFRWRRILLLSFLLISFINPLPDLQSWVKKQPFLKEMTINYAVVNNQLSRTTVILPSKETKRTVDVYQILVFIYFLGVIALGIRFIMSLISLFRQAIRCHERIFNGIKIKCLPEKSTPFSFFGWIFIAPSTFRNSRSKEILMHECTHARERHSFDIIFSEIITIICWMNPFAWLMKKEIRLNLEYLADFHVLITGSDPRQYQYQLLGLSTIDQSAGLCNNFNISYLKSRIIMMNKKRTHGFKRIKYTFFIPLTAILLFLFGNIAPVSADLSSDSSNLRKTVNYSAKLNEMGKGDSIYNIVEHQPQYHGGIDAELAFIAKNIRYPKDARNKGKKGRVFLQYVVEKDGSITNIHIVKNLYPSLDTEAIRIIALMPKWEPGRMHGKAVRCKYTLPVNFK